MTRTTTEVQAATNHNAAAEHRSAPLGAHALPHRMWLASPALPVGGLSYSEGLEAAVDSGRVSTEAQASTWLNTVRLSPFALSLSKGLHRVTRGFDKA